MADRLDAMSVFVAVAEAAGFAPAARRLNLSPPAVTRAVATLEARLGCRLLHRTTRSVRLTEAGERYLSDCRRILADLDEADRQAAGLHTAPRGTVTVSASVQFGRMVVTPILLDLLDRYKEMAVRAILVDRIVHLVDEGVDVAVRIADLPDSSLSAVRVGSVRRVLCAAPAYLADHGRPRQPSELASHQIIDFVAMAPGSEWSFLIHGKRHTVRPSARFQVNTADAAIAAALAGRGITRVLSYMIRDHVAAGALETVMADCEPPVVPVHVLHKEAGHVSARVRAAVDFLVERLRGDPAVGP